MSSVTELSSESASLIRKAGLEDTTATFYLPFIPYLPFVPWDWASILPFVWFLIGLSFNLYLSWWLVFYPSTL